MNQNYMEQRQLGIEVNNELDLVKHQQSMPVKVSPMARRVSGTNKSIGDGAFAT